MPIDFDKEHAQLWYVQKFSIEKKKKNEKNAHWLFPSLF